MLTDDVMQAFRDAWQICERYDDNASIYESFCLKSELERELRRRIEHLEEDDRLQALHEANWGDD